MQVQVTCIYYGRAAAARGAREAGMFLWRQITPTLLTAGLKALAGRTQSAVPEAPASETPASETPVTRASTTNPLPARRPGGGRVVTLRQPAE